MILRPLILSIVPVRLCGAKRVLELFGGIGDLPRSEEELL